MGKYLKKFNSTTIKSDPETNTLQISDTDPNFIKQNV